MNHPENLMYTSEHEWVKIENNIATVGITDFAQGELGDIIFLEFPDVDESFNEGDIFGTIEAVKTVSDLFMPVSGKIVEVNYMTSRVLLLSDLNSRIPVSIEPGSIQSILIGDGKNSSTIKYLKKEIDQSKEFIVYTSGIGGLLKPGIPIGKINKENETYNVDFFSDFTQLRYVKVSSYIEKENEKWVNLPKKI